MPLTQDIAYNLLSAAHDRARLAHALLISGPQGAGKSSLSARIIDMLNNPKKQIAESDLWGGEVVENQGSSEVNLEGLVGEFVQLVRPQSKTRKIKITQMRELEHSLQMRAPRGKWKVGVIWDCDRLGEEAANCFLKTLEEPPEQTILLLLTTSPERLLPTILSRCLHINLLPEFGAEVALPADVAKPLQLLSKTERGRVVLAMGLRANLEGYLSRLKVEIGKGHEARLKEEKEAYKKAVEEKWFEKREEEMKALIEADYQARRHETVGLLLSWLGDAVRYKAGASYRRLPSCQVDSSCFAEKVGLRSLLKRANSLIEMQQKLQETNATESLVLEVGLLEAFS